MEAVCGWWEMTKTVVLLGGPLVSGLIAAITVHWLTRSREREAREATRRAAVIERRNEFQRETLLSLQDSVIKLVRTTHSLHRLKSGKWQSVPIPKDVADDNGLAHAQATVLGERVRDETVRVRLQTLKEECIAAIVPDSSDELSTAAKQKLPSTLAALNRRIGEVLRELDDIDAA